MKLCCGVTPRFPFADARSIGQGRQRRNGLMSFPTKRSRQCCYKDMYYSRIILARHRKYGSVISNEQGEMRRPPS